MAKQRKMRVCRIAVSGLNHQTVDNMWHLYETYYENVDRNVFEADLSRKSMVFLATDRQSETVVGFSTGVTFEHEYRGRRVGIYFSGDTVMHPDYWGQKALHNAVCSYWLRWKLRHPSMRLYWNLICSGYRTYLTMVRNIPEYWPHHRIPTPQWEKGLIDSISRRQFGEHWRSAEGIVVTGNLQPVFKSRYAPFTRQVTALPEVEFFIAVNPGYARGDELSMIGRVDFRAFATIGFKAARHIARRVSLRRRRHAQTGATARPRIA